MKILHIITSLDRGGAEMLLVNLLSRLDQHKYISTVVSLTDGGDLIKNIEDIGIPVFSLKMKRGIPSITAILRLYKIVRNFKPDIVHGWMYHGNIISMLSSLLCIKKPKIFWGIFHCIEDLSERKWALKIVVKLGAMLSSQADGITNNSLKSITQHEKIGFAANLTTFVPNGVDTDLFHPDIEAYKSVRNELGVSNKTYLVGLIGRNDPLKDHSNFLNAALIVAASHQDIKFLIIGRGLDATNAWLSGRVHSLGLESNVILMGERHDIPRIIASLDVSVSSSQSEGMPLVIAESMSCGIPCVVTDVGDSSILVGDTGLSVPPRDSKALSGSITNIISLSEKDRLELGACARRRVINNYSLYSFVKKYESLYCFKKEL
jgi:glycosyltransferase involved in cell wall biosynthesis